MKIVPAPSPNGTNHERLFLVKLPSGPAGAYDAALSDEPDPAALRVELEKLLCEHLDGAALQTARERLEHHLGGNEYDRAASDEDDEDVDERAVEQAIERIEDFCRDRGLSADDIEEDRPLFEGYVRDQLRSRRTNGRDRRARDNEPLPRNATAGGMGGRLSAAEREEARDHKRMARDAQRRRQAFDARYPQAARLDGTLLETAYGSPMPEQRIATDSAAAKSSAERWPEAARIL